MRFDVRHGTPGALLPRVTPEESPAPPTIPDYELLRLVGRGSYGDVWLARGVTGLFRAIKIVWRARFTDAQPFEREFRGLKEFAAISLLESRQLALLHVGRNEAAGFFYYVMELADDAATGREIDPARYVPLTLKEVRDRRGRLPAAEVVALGAELARALAGLHTRGLVHRDIKPSNVILVGGAPKLADIGLVTTASAALTFVGTEGYVPPEGPGAPAADVFSLGKLLYELATGLDRTDYPRLPADFAALPDRKELLELNEVLVRACEPAATKRHRDAPALLDDLLLLQAGKSVRRLRAAERRLARALRMAAVLAIVASVAGTGAWIEHRRAATELTLREKAETERDLIARRSVYSATLARAQRALETDEPGLARRLLQTLAPQPGETDLRNFEWRVLWREAQGDSALVTHAGAIIKRLALSPDERLIAGQVGDDRAVVWDATTLQPVRTIIGTRLIGGFSADGEWLVGTDRAQGLQRWRLATGEANGAPSPGFNFPAQSLEKNRVLGLTNSTGGRAIGLRVWDFARQSEEFAFPLSAPDPGNWTYMPYPATTADGALCAVAIRNHLSPETGWRVQVYDIRSRQLVYERFPAARATALGLSSDGRRLAIAAADNNSIQTYDLAAGRLRWEQAAQTAFVRTLRFSHDGSRLLAGGTGSSARLFDAEDGHPLGEFRGHDVGVVDLLWTRDDRGIFSADASGDLRRWSSVPPRSLETNTRTGYWREKWIERMQTRSICVSPDGCWFAAPESDNVVRIASAQPAAKVWRVAGSYPLAVANDHRTADVLTMDGVFKRYALADSPEVVQEIALLGNDPSSVNFAALSADGATLVASTQSGKLGSWHFPSLEPHATADFKQASVWSALSPSGRHVAFAARDNVVRVAATSNAAVLGEINGGGSLRGTYGGAMSPDDSLLAVCLETGYVEIHSLPSLHLVQRLRTDSQTLYSVAFSPDGSRLFCGGAGGVVQVYSTDDWRLILALRSPPADRSDTTLVALGTNTLGTDLIGYRADGAVHLWTSLPPD